MYRIAKCEINFNWLLSAVLNLTETKKVSSVIVSLVKLGSFLSFVVREHFII